MRIKFLILFLFPAPLLAKSLEAMANSAKSSLINLGTALVALSFIWSGYLYIKGNMEGKEKLGASLTAAFLIFGVMGIITFIRKITG